MARQPYTYGQCTAMGNGSFTVHFDAAMYPFAPPVPDYLLKVESVMGFDPATWCVGSNSTLLTKPVAAVGKGKYAVPRREIVDAVAD
eukprot:COSAG03_NODE_11148_length_609_cov_1.027451_1_plen_86_part_10